MLSSTCFRQLFIWNLSVVTLLIFLFYLVLTVQNVVSVVSWTTRCKSKLNYLTPTVLVCVRSIWYHFAFSLSTVDQKLLHLLFTYEAIIGELVAGRWVYDVRNKVEVCLFFLMFITYNILCKYSVAMLSQCLFLPKKKKTTTLFELFVHCLLFELVCYKHDISFCYSYLVVCCGERQQLNHIKLTKKAMQLCGTNQVLLKFLTCWIPNCYFNRQNTFLFTNIYRLE